MSNSKDLDYMEERALHAVQELYAEYARPIGARAVCSFLYYRDTDEIKKHLKSLEEKGHLTSSAPGIWVPSKSSPEDKASIRKNLVHEQVKLLEHALETKTSKDLKRYVKRWCEDMEMHLA